ncbi:MAG TPA: glycerol-3-phosphate 1-O-acyltransferase PlsY [Clostridia bacterium]|nr:glycerol-3-phosphate 1-O-acyltransferase PlsY [Clostridia bacterium]
MFFKACLVIIPAYLLGSISFGIIVSKLIKKIDIRDYGSGNIGFTNVLRVVGKGPAALVLLGDALKGSMGVLLGYYLGGASYGYAVIGGIMAMLGHTYPLYFKFKGGKGVATGLGVIITLAPDVTLIALLIFLITVFISRYVSLGSLLAAISVPICMYLLNKAVPIFLFGTFGALFVIYNHRANIVRLYQGKENKIGKNQVVKRREEK